jgi:hypothetical protein
MSRVEDLKAPFGDGVTATNVLYFDCGSASQANAVPSSWAGKYIKIKNDSANLACFFFSKNASATCEETIAAAAAGAASASLGDSIAGGAVETVLLPYIAAGETLYFVRASASAATLRLSESSN